MSGSHIDTVRNGGWLDGIYGVCGALEVLETLAENPDSLKDTSFNYELVVFAEEEGSGFGSTMTGSKFITGIYAEADLDKLVSDTGMSLRQTLQSLSPYGAGWQNDRLQHRRFVSGSAAKRSLGF